MNKTKKLILDNFPIISIFIMSFVMIIPLIINGIPDGHDLIYHWSRIMGTFELINSGATNLRMLPGFYYNYGYPVSIFYPMGLLNLCVVLLKLGWSIKYAYIALIFLVNILTASLFYISTIHVSKSKYIRLFITFLYFFSTYRIYTDFYTRQALGEFIAFAFIPLVFYAIIEITFFDHRRWPLLTLGIYFLAITHTLSTMMIIIYLSFFVIFFCKHFFKDKKRIIALIKATLSTLVLSIGYLAPMFQMISRDSYQFQIPWTSSELNTLNSVNGLFYQRGIFESFPHGFDLVIFTILFILICLKRKFINQNKLVLFYLSSSFISIFVMSEFFPISILKYLGFLQFPWRLFVFISFFMMMSLGYFLSFINLKKLSLLISIIIVYTLTNFYLFSFNYFDEVKVFKDFPNYAYHYAAAEFLPSKVDMQTLMNRSFEQYIGSNQDLRIKYERDLLNYKIRHTGNTYSDTVLEIPLLYYIGYEIEFNNNNEVYYLDYYESENSLIQINLPISDNGNVNIKYVGTRIQDISMFVSVIAWLIFGGYLFWSKKKVK